MLLERDEKFYRFYLEDPRDDEAVRGLIAMGWHVVPVAMTEI